MKSSPDKLTSESRFFLEPTSAAQRQYEALRAYFVEGLSSADVAARFAYSPGSFRVLCQSFPSLQTRLLPRTQAWPPFSAKERCRPRTDPGDAQAEPLHLRHRKRPQDPADSPEYHRYLGDLARSRLCPLASAPG